MALTVLRWAALCAGGAGLSSGATSGAARRPPVKLIIDTDLGSDVSNLISVCSVNAMVDRGEAELLAVMTSTGQPAAIGAVSAANHFYGHDGVQLGAYKGPLATDEVCTICRGPYIDDLVANFSGPIKD